MTSFRLAFGSCLKVRDSGAFTRIAAMNPDFFYLAGDCWYDDGSSDHVKHWRDKFSAPKFSAMLANLPEPPIVGWSDHDAGFMSNSLAGPMTVAGNAAYRNMYPDVVLPPKGIYRTFVNDRVRFVLCDERSFKTARTMLGNVQETWLKALLADPGCPLVVILGDTPWVGAKKKGDDGWKGYSTERDELAKSFTDSPAQVIRLNGDMHCLAYGHDQFGVDRVWQAAPLHNTTKVKSGGGYLSTYPAKDGPVAEQFGMVMFEDTLDKITCTFTGYSADGTERLSDSLTVPTPAHAPTRDPVPARFGQPPVVHATMAKQSSTT